MNTRKIQHEIEKIDMEIMRLIARRNSLTSGSGSSRKGKKTRTGKEETENRNCTKEETYFPDI